MILFYSSLLLVFCQAAVAQTSVTAYTAPGPFPTSAFASYWNDPTATSAQPQPVISDPVSHSIFLANLTNPANFPKNDTVDPHPLPTASTTSSLSPSQMLNDAIAQIEGISTNSSYDGDRCAQCIASLEVAQALVAAYPEQGAPLAQAICVYFQWDSDQSCYNQYSNIAIGSILSQVVALADVSGYDGQNLCSRFDSLCPVPPAVPLNMTDWFAKPKPDPLPPAKQSSGQRLKVLQISDIHVDPRYATGSEANCTQFMCCRDNVFNVDYPDTILQPASRYGDFWCDLPVSTLLAAMQAVPPLTGTEESGFDFILFTGDLTAHDPNNEYSRAYVEYAEVILYNLMKEYFGTAPIYATVGNHDTYDQFMMMPYTMGGSLGSQFNWLYEHISSMWYYENWLGESTVEAASTNYAGYSVVRSDGLRIISLDTDNWYRDNYLGYINSTDPDRFGMMRFLTDELQDAEDAGDRVWIIGHVLAGWDGEEAQSNPTNLFYQIVDRYSPHVIANIFWGHTHEDQLSIFYANNGTVMSADTALAVSWIGPSLTPLTDLNSGFRMYEVDSETFDILDAYTWISDVNEFPALDDQTENGPTYFLEYSTREAYGGNISWSSDDPLNATWWHLVTEQMENDDDLVKTFYEYESKSSVKYWPCSGDCIPDTICYIRSGSATIALENCKD